MTDITAERIEALKELIAKATPAEKWKVSGAALGVQYAPCKSGTGFFGTADNATAVLALLTDAPDLLKELERLRAEGRAGIYVASRASVPERGQMWRALRDKGVRINSTWIDEDGPGQSPDLGDLWRRIEREVTTSERLILYAEADDFPLKGALIEVGMALSAGVPVYVVLPGVELEPRSMRPLGSWALHPLVTFAASVESALPAPPSVEEKR